MKLNSTELQVDTALKSGNNTKQFWGLITTQKYCNTSGMLQYFMPSHVLHILIDVNYHLP
jgi:hypothetical protein